MTVQVLVTTMHAVDFSKIVGMNLHNVDVIIANQTDHCEYAEQDFPERNVHAVMVSTNTRGVSLNRNIGMAYASADVIVYADDDMRFEDHAFEEVVREFTTHPEADAIKFGCVSRNADRPLSYSAPSSFQKASILNIMSSGVPALALRKDKIEKYDLSFPQSIGPGREYSCGEDSFFIKSLLQFGLKIYRSPIIISYVDQSESSWFHGYDDSFFVTQGYVYAKNYGWLTNVMLVRRAYKLSKDAQNSYTMSRMLTLMREGANRFRC